MHEALQIKQQVKDLRDPILIAGFAVRQRAGRLANAALIYLTEAWHAELVAEIDPDDFLDLTVRRPEQRRPDNKVVIEWPRTQIFVAKPPGAKHDFLLLGGFEPHFRWPTFVSAITEYLEPTGARTMISLRSFPGSVPHTRPTPVNLTASNVELEVQFGVQAETTRYEGPADLAAVLGVRLQSLGWETVELSAIQPYYFPRMPNPAVTISLVKLLDHAFGIETPIDSLQTAAEEASKVVEESFANNAEARTMVQELEEAYDQSLDRLSFLAETPDEPSALPTGEELIQDIERLFRESGQSGGPS
jgi:predicted ATP-grasp superfamily ATP-dependent carboligase